MTKEETASYIEHHLTIAGRQNALFSDDAVELIHLTSRTAPLGQQHRLAVPHRGHHRDARDRVTTSPLSVRQQRPAGHRPSAATAA